MPPKKKQNKKEKKPKTTRKLRAKREIKAIVQQAIPNYASEQNIRHDKIMSKLCDSNNNSKQEQIV